MPLIVEPSPSIQRTGRRLYAARPYATAMHGVCGISKSPLIREFATEIDGSHSAGGRFLDKRIPLYRSWREARIFIVIRDNPWGKDIAAPKAEDDRNWFRARVEHTGKT